MKSLAVPYSHMGDPTTIGAVRLGISDDSRRDGLGKTPVSSVPLVRWYRRHEPEKTAAAATEWGFFQVVNHGISETLVDKVREQAESFFALPMASKEAILRTRENPWGYYNNELTKNQRDKKEVFDYTSGGRDSIYKACNRWLDFDPQFRNVMEDYRDACVGLSLRLLEAFCRGLGLPADFLNTDFHPSHTGFIRLKYYPVKDPLHDRTDVTHRDDAGLGVRHHTDTGALTVLLQDDVGGLQVHKDRHWHDVPSVRNALVINTGDMMQVWSNDVYHAALHRSIGWSEYRGRRTGSDYADYGAEVQISQYRI